MEGRTGEADRSRPHGSGPVAGSGGATDMAALESVMAALAEGDGAAIVTLISHFGEPMGMAVRSIAKSRGARLDADDVEELVTEVAIVVADLAKAWKPEGGAPPWVWARQRVAQVVDRHIGQWHDSLDAAPVEVDHDVSAPQAPSGSEESLLVVLDRLATSVVEAQQFREILTQVASPRDRILFLESLVQVSLGDRSPAVSVGQLIGMRPDAVRQQHGRVRRRIREMAAGDPKYAALADLPVVA